MDRYYQMKESNIYAHRRKAEAMLSKFKKENAHMLTNKEVVNDYIRSIDRESKRKYKSIDSWDMFDLKVVLVLFFSFFHFFFQMEWLSLLLCLAELFIFYFIFIVQKKLEKNGNNEESSFRYFIFRNNEIFNFFLILVLYSFKMPFLQKFGVFLIHEICKVLTWTLKKWNLVSSEKINFFKYFEIIIFYIYFATLTVSIVLLLPKENLRRFFLMIFFGVFHLKVGILYLFLINLKKCHYPARELLKKIQKKLQKSRSIVKEKEKKE